VAIGLAAVVQAGDGLLPDVAALREAHGALVEAGLLRDDRVVEVDAVARAAALDAQHLRGGLVDRHGAGVDEVVADALGVVAFAENVHADVRADQQHLGAAKEAGLVGVLGPVDLAGQRGRTRADQGQQAALERALVQLAVEAHLEAPQRVEQGLQRGALAEQQQLRAGVDHAQVGKHLALVREQRRVAPLAGFERLDVVGQLAVEERLGVGARERELPALGAVDESNALGHRGIGVHRATSYPAA
jgi:hypothetical protein